MPWWGAFVQVFVNHERVALRSPRTALHGLTLIRSSEKSLSPEVGSAFGRGKGATIVMMQLFPSKAGAVTLSGIATEPSGRSEAKSGVRPPERKETSSEESVWFAPGTSISTLMRCSPCLLLSR